jgi:type IV secretion system protein TrbL
MIKSRYICLAYYFIAVILFSFTAFAADSSSNILNNVTDKFQSQASTWGGIITGYATWLFWLLGTISLVWTGGTLVLKRADIGEFFAEFIRFSVFFGFFLWLLQNAAGIGTAIINSLIQIGANASSTGASNPSAVMDIGFQIFYKVMQQTSVWSPVDSFIGAILAGIILIGNRYSLLQNAPRHRSQPHGDGADDRHRPKHRY